MYRVGINGLGRIGRAILRSNLKKNIFDVVAINDINPDVSNIAYTLNYDTIYGRLDKQFISSFNTIHQSNSNEIRVFNESSILKVPWKNLDVDFVIDSSGIHRNVIDSHKLISNEEVKKVFITHSPKEVDFTMVLGVNESKFNYDKHNVISTSICDATAISPTLNDINKKFGIESGSITTMHPWLSYQNLTDGSSSSWSVPGEVYHHFALGRSAIGNIIPKPTSAVEVSCSVLEGISEDMFLSFSYRTPTAIVGSADLTLNLKNNTSTKEVIEFFNSLEKKQSFNIYKNNSEPLVSLDFIKADYSCVIDHRWTEIKNENLLKIVLWYDNEWGYSNRVIDQINYIAKK